MARKKPPTEEELRAAVDELAAQADIAKLEESAIVMTIALPGNKPDPVLALQIGIALLLEKPLILVAVRGAWLPQRLRQLADAVVEGPSIADPETAAKLQAAMADVMRRKGLIQ